MLRRVNRPDAEAPVVRHSPEQGDVEGHPAKISAARRGGGGPWGRPRSGRPERTVRGVSCCSGRALPDARRPLPCAGPDVIAQGPRALSPAVQLRGGDGGRAVRVPTSEAGAGETTVCPSMSPCSGGQSARGAPVYGSGARRSKGQLCTSSRTRPGEGAPRSCRRSCRRGAARALTTGVLRRSTRGLKESGGREEYLMGMGSRLGVRC